MATVTGYTAAKMQEINDTTIIDGDVIGDNLILHPRNAPDIDAGNVRGPQGDKGDTGIQGIQGVQGIQGQKGDTGDIGELVAHSETTVGTSGTTEAIVASFVVPAGFKSGDRLRLLTFGSLVNTGTYTAQYIARIKIDGSIVGVFSNLQVGANGAKTPFTLEYLLWQDAVSSWINGTLYTSAGNQTVDTSSDVCNMSYSNSTGLLLSNPAILLPNKTISLTVQGSTSPPISLFSAIRGFHVEHYHAKTP